MSVDAASRRRAILLLALLVLIWGVNWVIAKMSLAYISPIWVTALRLLPACVLFFGLCLFTGRLKVPVRADLPVVFSIGLLHMVGFSVLVSIGIQYMSAGKSIVLAYTTPLWVLPAAWFFLGEKLTPRKLTGLVVGMLGLVLLLQPGELDWSDRDVLIGHGFVLLAALFWAGSIVYGRAHKWVTPPFALLPWQMLVGGLTQLVLALVIEGLPQIKWSVEFVLLVGFNCLLDLPASAVSMGLLGVPVVGLVCSSLVLDETLGVALLIAAALIIFGIILGTTTPRKNHEQK